MKLVYTAGPYTAKHPYQVHQNIEISREMSLKIWKAGHAALSPHLNSAQFDGIATYKVFLEGTLIMMERCDAVVMLSGWEKSRGSIGEEGRAKELGIPVFYSWEELEEWLKKQE